MNNNTYPPLSIIVAIAQNNVIGNNNDLIWHIGDDLRYFKKVTSGHTVVMGRKTWHSLQVKPLPKRKNIVITRNKDLKLDGVYIVRSMEEAVAECDPDTENFIIGGAEIYRLFLPWVNKLYLTHVHKDFVGDALFPSINYNDFNLIDSSETYHDEKSGLDYHFAVYERKNK